MEYKVKKYGAQAFIVQFNNEISKEIHHQIRFLYEGLRRFPEKGIQSVIPAYSSLTVHIQKEILDIIEFQRLCASILENFDVSKLDVYKVVLPVCYEEEFSLDIKLVEKETGLLKEEIIKKHTSSEYLVYMLGFIPGFLYLGGLSNDLFCPRLDNPRLTIPRGSVGIGGEQTGVYPLESPGGWQIIGNCPLDLIGDGSKPLIEMGDYIQFEPILIDEYKSLIGKNPERILMHEG